MGNLKFKVNDRVRVKSLEWYNDNKDEYGYVECGYKYFTKNMRKYCGNVVTISSLYYSSFYNLTTYNIAEGDDYSHAWSDDMFEGLAEDTIQPVVFENIVFPNENYADKVELCLGNDYEIVVEDGRTFVQKKKPKYPMTYEECCGILGITFDYPDIRMVTTDEFSLYSNFIQLIRCRDAYWKIAGEEMELNKPWNIDWEKSDSGYVYCIVNKCNNIGLTCEWIRNNYILSFPTVEIRDMFFENFKDLIENCKELL